MLQPGTVISVKQAGTDDVYDLSVADCHEFFASGVLVHNCWCDEVGLWGRGWQRAWHESLQFAVRHEPGRIIATGTPKAGHGLIKELLDDPRIPVTIMRTLDNADHLAPSALADLLERYKGKRLGRQELEAEFLEDVEGALWTLAQIEALRVSEAPPLVRIIVGVDPQGSSSEAANAGGVIVAGITQNKVIYVLDDRTTERGGPRAWAKAAVDAYHYWEADRIVAERNFGGEMVAITIGTVDPTVPVKLVNASRGKRPRAEPYAALYEGGEDNPARVHHVGVFSDLEGEMVSWTPDGPSPNRMDALVWALTELWKRNTTGMVMHSPRGRIPSVDSRENETGLLPY